MGTSTNGFKRLFIDCETSPNVVYSWRIGRKIDIDHSNIIQERSIITICYKWEGDDDVRSLTWGSDGSDKRMLERFMPILLSADEVIAHNGDRFDLPWIRTRCIYHRIRIPAQLPSVDTLKQARRGFMFNSNKLDYLGGYLGHGNKQDTGGFRLWKSVMDGDKKSLAQMVEYCKRDVELLEKVWSEFNDYTAATSHKGVLLGGYKHHCPKCASENTKRNRKRTTALGTTKVQMICNDCKSYWSMSEATYAKSCIDEYRAMNGLDPTKIRNRRKGSGK